MSDKPQHKTLYAAPVADARGAGQPKATPKIEPITSDITRVRPAYAAAACGTLGVVGVFLTGDGWSYTKSGPGPLHPAHVKAKLGCEKCHGKADPESASSRKKAKGACVDCHGPHPSTREGHRQLAADGKLVCVSCHTVHGPESGVRFTESGDAVRFSTWNEVAVEGIPFNAGRDIVVPTIPLSACQKCHDTDASDPLARCRSHEGGGPLEPTICFDEHRSAFPAAAAGAAAQKPSGGVCADQHFEDRSFAWEAAREVVAEVPVVPRKAAAGGAFGFVGVGAAAALLGYAGTSLLQRARKTKRDPRGTAPAQPSKARRLPVVNTNTCLGCYACVDACPYGVLEVERFVAVVARPDACCGLVLCEQRCPNGSLVVAEEGTVLEQPSIDGRLESEDVPGLYLAGDVTGVPLIKNAISQGVRAAEAAHLGLSQRAKALDAVDVCVVGAGPAGISASLRLKELGASSITLEQGGVAQSIKSFPRGKLVFDQPLELPVLGKLWLKESSKEELLLHWMRIVRKEALEIREQSRMTGVERRPDGTFLVRAETADGAPLAVAARSVIVAIGQRGSPRLLPVPIPEDAESLVHYHLADARSLAGQRVVVAGLGDTAMEAAIALASQPRTSVTIVARAATYARGQPRNIAEVERLRKARRLDVRFGTEIASVHAGWLELSATSGREKLPFDALFVLIGSIPPWELLARVGVQRRVGPVPAPLPSLPLDRSEKSP